MTIFSKIYYIQKKLDKNEDDMNIYTEENYPSEIAKKVTLLGYFKKYLQLEEKQKKLEEMIEKNSDNEENFQIYVKKWKRTNESILFRLSNKIYQVIFNDKSQIILSSETRTIIYKTSEGEKKIFPIAASLKFGDDAMNKKIQYVKELLSTIYANNLKMMNSRQKENKTNVESK